MREMEGGVKKNKNPDTFDLAVRIEEELQAVIH